MQILLYLHYELLTEFIMYIFTVILLFVFVFFRFTKTDQFYPFQSFKQTFSHIGDKTALERLSAINLISQ